MAELLYVNNIDGYEDALQLVLMSIEMRIDPRMAFWSKYAIINIDRDELRSKLLKDTAKLARETHQKLNPETFFYVAIPRFKLLRRDIPHLSCEVSIYYAACGGSDGESLCWYGKLVSEADTFRLPLCLIARLLDALEQGEFEIADARIVERGSDYSIYDFMNGTWKVPDVFIAFCWALARKGRDFSGLLDPLSCQVMAKFVKELPALGAPILSVAGSYYEQVVSALTNLGYSKNESERAANYVLGRYPSESLENLISQSLKYLGSKQS